MEYYIALAVALIYVIGRWDTMMFNIENMGTIIKA